MLPEQWQAHQACAQNTLAECPLLQEIMFNCAGPGDVQARNHDFHHVEPQSQCLFDLEGQSTFDYLVRRAAKTSDRLPHELVKAVSHEKFVGASCCMHCVGAEKVIQANSHKQALPDVCILPKYSKQDGLYYSNDHLAAG